MRVVAALGGNALLRRGEPADAEAQRRNVATAVAALARVAEDHELVVTHGNGPQVGLLALQSEAYRALDDAVQALVGEAGTLVTAEAAAKETVAPTAA